MPHPLPVPATYLPPSSTKKVIDLLDLCRRLIAQWQYSDLKRFTNLSSYERSASKETLDKLADEMEKDLIQLRQSLSPQERNALKAFLKEKVTVSKIGMPFSSLNLMMSHGLDQGKKPTITVKQFKNQSCEKISEKELRKIYWGVRMRYSCATVNQVVGKIVGDLKQLRYQGFLLPNGNMVTFESMNYVILEFVPKNISFVDFNFSLPALNCSEIIESPMRIEKNVGPFVQHVALCFSLPASPNNKILVIDQTGTQFGLYGVNGEMVHWNYIEDYLKAFPAHEIKIYGYERFDYHDDGFYPNGPHMIEQTLRNINLPSCNYCGEVEGREIRKELTIMLKKCSNCKQVRYCDVTCQKLGWRGHKIVCKSG